MNRRWQDYRPENLTFQQRITAIVALIIVVHFAVGTSLWLYFIISNTLNLARNSRPGQFWINLVEWLPFYWRSCKSMTPLGLSVLAIYFTPRRVKSAIALLCGIVISAVVFAWYDISSEHYDIATFSPSDGHLNHYFTWWWCHQRPK